MWRASEDERRVQHTVVKSRLLTKAKIFPNKNKNKQIWHKLWTCLGKENVSKNWKVSHNRDNKSSYQLEKQWLWLSTSTVMTQELIDFCHKILGRTICFWSLNIALILKLAGTDVTASHCCQDGREASNLLSSDKTLKANGYLSDYFIKPPVSITLAFRAPIFISHISVDLSKRTRGLEILVPLGGELVTIARFFNRKSPFHEKAVFQNFRYPGNQYSPQGHKTRLGQTHFLNSVKEIVIKVLATDESLSPALSNLQIWGKISGQVDKHIAEEINLCWLALSKRQSSLIIEQNSVPRMYGAIEEQQHQLQEEVKEPVSSSSASPLPQEFLDSLTLTRMNVPMLLPSGQRIDRDTLDKYNKNEAIWGRAPNDPFTGKFFTETLKPIFDSSLKARIDAFVLKLTPESINVVPGGASSLQRSGGGARRQSGLKRREVTCDSTPASCTSEAKEEKSSAKRSKVDQELPPETSCSSDLDNLLNQALAGRERILGQSSNLLPCCSTCKQTQPLYKLNCHRTFYCRTCLLKVEKGVCSTCDKTWTRQDFTKFHIYGP